MSSRMIFKAPVLAMIAAFGVTMISGDAAAQQPEDQPEQAQQCRAILSPSTLTATSAQEPEEEQRRQQRVAGKMTLQARLTEDIGNVTEVKIEENSNIQASLAQEEQEEAQTEQQRTEQQQEEQRRQQRQTEEAQGQNHVPVEVDVSEAEEGEWEVTFMGEGNQECTGTLRVRGSGPAR